MNQKTENPLISWDAREREKYIRELSETEYDVLIVGGGITGAGVLRALGLRGIRAALIEKEDFAFGTSSKSTRLAHGGARYIVNLEFGLVWEETHERDWMRGAFPNLVRPVPIIFANYSGIESLAMRLYFDVYDGLCGWKNHKNSRHLKKRDIEKLEPNVKPPGLHSGTLIYECILNDARLTLEIIKEGVILGGTALNYVDAKRVIVKDGRATGLEVLNRETGRTFTIKAKNIVNASGPWTDGLMPEDRKPMIRPAKGVHIIVKRESIGNTRGLYVKSPVDGRGVFVMAHGDFTYIGTTDTDYKGDLDECYTEREEYEYFKGIVDNCFPDANFDEKDLIGSYAGTRPLVFEAGVSEDKTSRKEFIDQVCPGFFVITGGKLTIFRTMAEKLLTFMAEKGAIDIKKSDNRLSKSRIILGMTSDEWRGETKKPEVDEETALHIYQNYGRGGPGILQSVKKDPGLGEKVTDGQPNIQAEIDYCLEYEMVTHLKDFLLRRTNLSLHQRDNHEALGRGIATRMAKHLGWDDDRVESEIKDYVELAHKNRFFLKGS